jgi:molecular chaperone DnaK (HSP70)
MNPLLLNRKLLKYESLNVLIHDLGRGTFDLSILEIEPDLSYWR